MAKLGFITPGDCQFFSKKLVKYWRQTKTREEFIRLEQTELSVIAEDFLLSEGRQLWNGERFLHPLWPMSPREERDWIQRAKTLLTKILEGQQGYQIETIKKELKKAENSGNRSRGDVAMDDDSSCIVTLSSSSHFANMSGRC